MHFRSLTTRLIFWTLLASGGVLAATLVASTRLARQTAVDAAELEARQAADRLANRVRAVLAAVEESAQLLAAALETVDPDPRATESLLRRFVASGQHVYGAAAAYAPEAAPAGGGRPARRPFAPYVFGEETDPSRLRYVDLAAAGIPYTRSEWYARPAATGQSSWSEPYVDEASGRAMVTYSVPVFSGQGAPRRLRGVATADVPLHFLARIVAEVHPGQNGRALVLSQAGRILALSESGRLEVDAPLLEQLPPERRAELEPLVRHMLAGASGFLPAEMNGRAGRVIYQPIGIAEWSLGVFYPEQDFMAGAQRLRLVEATLGLLGLLVLAAVVVALSRRLTAPLRELAGAARGLAANLDAELPAPHSRDELGALATAFGEMRDALRRYVHDLEVTTAAKQRLESELAIAKRIQMDMLPSRQAGSPEEGYELAALLEPARQVGGDLFDHLASAGHVFFLVADVSGKGVPAALFMARAKTLFEAAAARQRDPSALLAEVNRGLCRENEAGMYVTAVCGVVELATGELCFACAGHEPPVRLGRGAPPLPLETEGGTVLGLLDGAAYPQTRVCLSPGEAVFACTDGVNEAFDADGALFGTPRLLDCLASLAAAPPEAVNAGVRDAVRAFAGAARQSDDITALTLRYRGPASR